MALQTPLLSGQQPSHETISVDSGSLVQGVPPQTLEERVQDAAIPTIKGSAEVRQPTRSFGGKIIDYLAAGGKTFAVGVGYLITFTWVRDFFRGGWRLCLKRDREVLKDGYEGAVAERFQGVPSYSCSRVRHLERALMALNILDPRMPQIINRLERHPGYQYLLRYEPQHPAVQYVQNLRAPQNLGDIQKYQPQDILLQEGRGISFQEGRDIRKFESSLRDLDIQSLAQDPTELREEIASLSKYPGYKYLLQYDPNHRAVKYLQDLGVRLESADGREAFRAYGERRSGQYLPKDSDCQYSDLVGATRRAQRDFSSHRDNKLYTAAWSISNPRAVAHVSSAHTDPAGYDSYHGQSVFMGDMLEDQGQRIHIKFTPGLTGENSIVEDVLIPAYRAEGKRWVFISNQSMHAYDERQRINVVHGWSERHGDTFRQAVLSTDIAKQREFVGILREHTSQGHLQVDAYMDDFERLVRGTNGREIDDSRIRDFGQAVGFYIPDDLLNKEALDAVFAAVREMIQGNPQFENMRPKDAADVIRRTIISTLSWAIMKKEQMTHQDSIFSTACKEMIDRAVMEYMEIRGNELMYQGQQELPQADAQFVSGVVLGRAHLAMERPPQKKRMDPIVTRTNFFQHKEHSAFGLGHDALQRLAGVLVPLPPRGNPNPSGLQRAADQYEAEDF